MLLATTLAVGACAGSPKPIELKVTPGEELARPKERATLPMPRPISELPLRFVPIRDKDGKLLYLALTPRGYATYERNMAEVARWAREAVYQIKYYSGRLPAPEAPPKTGEPAK